MKTIIGIDDKPTHWQDDLPADAAASIPTFRRMFRAALGMGLAKDGENAMDLVQVGMKLKLDGPDASLEDAEFKLLKERCDKNPAQWVAHFHGQVMMKFKEAENRPKGA